MEILNAVIAEPIDQVSDHFLIEVRLEATLIERGQVQQQEVEEIDPRTLPQMNIRKVMKECLEKGVFRRDTGHQQTPLGLLCTMGDSEALQTEGQAGPPNSQILACTESP